MVLLVRLVLLLGVASWYCCLSNATPAVQPVYAPAEHEDEPAPAKKVAITEEGAEDMASQSNDSDSSQSEGRSCGNCGVVPNHNIHDLTHLELPQLPIFPMLPFPDLTKLKDKAILGLVIPIFVMQIVTLAIVAYLLKMEKKYDDTGSTGTSGYYAAYPIPQQDYNMDTYSSYRSLMPSEDTMSWVLEKLSSAVDLYQDYNNQRNEIDH